ncbi:DNRLRE domain-containing protein [Nocardioides cavernaquae]|uniref:DNRLRE domain-containing protein n=1 Tax=Nocardioides cavernaquae TaxID=2321396 RepID=A0A3A5HAY9_9ACTN|nr:DNRLRE domain-containing protein [Nocardioides cavernaquae]RJS47241.1 DNRLRE domain-containing protein [Nocardioides cavernaquae]
MVDVEAAEAGWWASAVLIDVTSHWRFLLLLAGRRKVRQSQRVTTVDALGIVSSPYRGSWVLVRFSGAVRAISPVVSTALVIGACQVLASSASPATAAPAAVAIVADRGDPVSAMSTARAQGKRVEDLSQRTPSTATYATPSGSWITEAYSGLVRSKVDEDKWVDIDPSINSAGKGFEPKAVPFDVLFSEGQDKKLATVSADGGAALSVQWPNTLPTAEPKGDTLTFPKAAGGSDLVVTSRPDGFNFSVKLDQAPAAGAAPLKYQVPLHLDKGRFRIHDDGSFEVLQDGHVVAAMTPPLMWDTAKDAERVPVAATVEGEGGDRVLVLRPDMAWLTDPARVAPITVDPTLTLTSTGDTWVESFLNPPSHEISPELQVGSNSLGLNVARSYANFDISGLTSKPGAVVSSASLQLSNFETGSCAGTAIRVSQVTSSWSVPNITYSNQPTTTATGSATSTQSFGASGCGTEGTVSFDAKAIVQAWQGGAANYGVQIKADNESANTGWRKYRSLENGDTAKAPKLSITYNTPPAVPSYNLVTPAGAVGSTFYTRETKPTFTTTPTDPDGDQVTAELRIQQGGSTVQSWTSGQVASGAGLSHALATALHEGAYAASWRVSDGSLTSAWSPDQAFNVDVTAPATPVMSCTNYPNNSWQDPRPAATTTCTVTASADSQWAAVHDGHEWINVPPLNNNTTSFSFSVPTDSTFGFWVVASDAAGNWATSTYTFGVGDGGFYSPENGAQFAGPLQVNAGAPSGAYAAVLNWRTAGTTTWTQATQVKKAGANWTGGVDTSGAISRTGDLIWQADAETGITSPATLEIQACFTYWTAPTQRCGKTRQVTLVQHAFGGSYPTTEVGPASVALMTGEYQTSSTDVTVPGYRDTLSIGRTFQSLGAPVTAAESVFGPGWIANLQGPSWGFASGQVVDTTATDGTIQLLDPSGAASVYKLAGPAAQAVGVYTGQGPTAGDNAKLELKGGTPKTLELTEADGVITTWTNVAGTNKWNVTTVVDPSAAPATTFSYNGDYVTGIYSAPPGVTCNATTQSRGCRALQLSYTGTGTSTRLTQVDLRTWDPKPGTDGSPTAAAGMVTVPVAKYSYDASNRLASVWDPRLDYGTGGSSHVATGYGYQTIGGRTQLASITPAGEKTWNFTLDGTTGVFKGATREQDAAVGGTATWAVKYNVAVSGAGLPDLAADTAKTWGQKTVPATAAAVFGPDAPGTTDYTYANLTYFTSAGVTTNTANYGSGEWLIDTIEYDTLDNPVWSLSAGNRAARLKDNWTGNQIRAWGGDTRTYSADGTRVETDTSPIAWLTKKDGTGIVGGRVTRYDYDDEAPAGDMPGRPAEWTADSWPRHNVLIKATTTVDDGWGVAAHDPETTWYRYQPVVTGDGSGWTLGQPTRVSTSLGAGWSTNLTRFDTQGRTIETRTPQGVATVDGTANDARSRITSYYTADATAPVAACRNKPEWIDAVCSAGPAGGTAPTTTTEGFDYLGLPTRAVETTGSTQRITVTSTDQAGRTTKVALTTVNAPTGQQAVPDTTFSYANATGRLTGTTAGGSTASTTSDSWGRIVTQTDGAGNTATSTYNAAGRPATFNDGKGTYTYTWNGTDANGKTERRGLLTAVNVGLPGGPSEFKTGYDQAGAATTLVYPNGVYRATTYDALGNEATRAYNKADGTSLLTWQQFFDRDGRVRANQTVGVTLENYEFDGRGRLTKVKDNVWGQCTTRVYDFSLDSNRNSLTSYAPAADGTCSTTTTPTVTNGTYDGDDRKTNTGYVHDALGRTTTLPSADTDKPSDGNVTATYYANDLVAGLNRPGAAGGAQAKTWGLDALGRLASMSSTTGGVELRKTTSHYDDSSDSPAWISEDTRPNAQTAWTTNWTRNVLDPTGALGLIQSSDGTSRIQLVNPHGDIVSTLNNAPTIIGLENYNEATEYGAPRTQFPALGQAYTWLGSHRRSGDALAGLTLMGVRLYDPASGRFLSSDPVYGGNDNAYAYPADPINQFDTTGKWCRFQVGTTCTRYAKGPSGQSIPVRHWVREKVWNKHNISWETMKFVIRNMYYLFPGANGRDNYGTQLHQVSCRWIGRFAKHCERTGVTMMVRTVIDWGDSSDGKTMGVVTMYCRRAGTDRCPDWVNNLE